MVLAHERGGLAYRNLGRAEDRRSRYQVTDPDGADFGQPVDGVPRPDESFSEGARNETRASGSTEYLQRGVPPEQEAGGGLVGPDGEGRRHVSPIHQEGIARTTHRL